MHKVSERGWKSPWDPGDTRKRDTRWRETGRRRSLISLLPPRLACPRAQSPHAFAYFVNTNEGLVVAHGTSGPTKKSRTSLFTNKTCLLTVLCRRDPAWTHLVPWMQNISYWRCPFCVCSAWIRKILLCLRIKIRRKRKILEIMTKNDFFTIATSQRKIRSIALK